MTAAIATALRRLAAAAGLLALAGCTWWSKPDVTIDHVLASWLGKSETELTVHFGVPRRAHRNTDGTRLLEYVGYWSDQRQYPCEVRFIVSPEGRVSGFSYASVPVGAYGSSCGAPLGTATFTTRHMHPSARPGARPVTAPPPAAGSGGGTVTPVTPPP